MIAAAALAATLLLAPAPDPDPGKPRKSDVREEVEVRLVLVDAVVVDRTGRTVSGLTIDDFELFVDYDPVPLDTLDVVCPGGGSEDVRAVRGPKDRRDAVAPDAARKIVLVFDYMHLHPIARAGVLEQAQEMIRSSHARDEEILIAAITGDLRIEQDLTRDRQAVLETLHRMEYDISLWQPEFAHLHELRFFRSLKQLIDLVGLVPGSKAVVLFSNLGGGSAGYDLEFEAVSSRATHARVAIYPVHAVGMGEATAPKLARLAVETGGRFTERTNDLSLGYARAQRDLTCRYALGFYDRNPDRGKARRVSIRVRGRGMRALHSYNYEFSSPEEQREALLTSGHLSPATFRDPRAQAYFFPLRPAGRKSWDGLVAMRFPVDGEAWHAGEITRDHSVAAERNGRIVARNDRTVRLVSNGRHIGKERAVTLLGPIRLKAGRYAISSVVSDPRTPQPWTAVTEVDLPRPPSDGLFVVGPVLGRPAGASGVTEIPAPDRDFEPLLDHRVGLDERLLALTRVCRVGKGKIPDGVLIGRTLREDGGFRSAYLSSDELELEPSGRVRCHTMLERVPTSGFPPGRYVWEVSVRGQGETPLAEAATRFALEGPD